MKKTYAILADQGIPMDSPMNSPVAFIEAETATEARKEFKRIWEGHTYASGKFKATRIFSSK